MENVHAWRTADIPKFRRIERAPIPQPSAENPLRVKRRAETNPTGFEWVYTARIASSGEQLDPCSHQFRGDAVERDALVRNGAEAPRNPRAGAHRGTLPNTTSRTPPGSPPKGVKNLPVRRRRPNNCTGARGDTRRRSSNRRRLLGLPPARPTRSGLSISWTAGVLAAEAPSLARLRQAQADAGG